MCFSQLHTWSGSSNQTVVFYDFSLCLTCILKKKFSWFSEDFDVWSDKSGGLCSHVAREQLILCAHSACRQSAGQNSSSTTAHTDRLWCGSADLASALSETDDCSNHGIKISRSFLLHRNNQFWFKQHKHSSVEVLLKCCYSWSMGCIQKMFSSWCHQICDFNSTNGIFFPPQHLQIWWTQCLSLCPPQCWGLPDLFLHRDAL